MPPVAMCGNRSRRVTFQASPPPVFWTSMAKLPHCPRFIVDGPDFVTTSTGSAALATVLIVGSFGAGVRGSSEGWLTMPVAFTKPWFEITVPATVLAFTTTSNVMVATLAGLLDASGGIKPGVALAGELIGMPFTSGDTPATSATAAPFRVVLPATYAVFAGTASRNATFTASALLMFFTVIV